MRTASTSHETHRSETRDSRDEEPAARKPAGADELKRFQALMARQVEPAPVAAADPLGMQEQPTRKMLKGGGENAPPPDLSALVQAQRIAWDSAAAGVAPPPSNPQATLAELLEKHVRQLLISESSARSGQGEQLMLRLADATLPGTDLMLTRTEGGWALRAECTRADSYESIRKHAPALVARFAEKSLGELQIMPVLHA